MRRAILAALIVLAMVSTVLPVASGPIQFGHVWGTVNDEYANAIEIDSAGNLILSGVVQGPPIGEAFVTKVGIQGNLMWDRYLSSPSRSLNIYDSALGPSDSVYVVGVHRLLDSYTDGVFYAKIDSSGSLVYQKFLPGLVSVNRICSAPGYNGFTIVGDMSVYGTGVVVSVSDAGNVLWSVNASFADGVSPWAVTTDSSGNIYVFMDSSNDANVALSKFDSSGSLLKQIVLLTDQVYEYTWDLAIGNDGNIYALGADYGSGSLLLACFTPQLDLVWDEFVGTPMGGFEATRIVIAQDNSLYAVGYSTYAYNSTPGPAVFHLTSTGGIIESMFYAWDSSLTGLAMNDAVANPAGGIIIAGSLTGIPQLVSTAIQGVTVTEIPDVWAADSVSWSNAGLTATAGDISSQPAGGSMDNYDPSQGRQAWYGVMDMVSTAFDVSVSTHIVHDSTVVNFRAHSSGGHSPYSYSWNFGDGSSGAGSRPSHEYATGGMYHVIVAATDSTGQMSWTSTDVVLPANPVISQLFYNPDPANEGQTILFQTVAYDPDGGALAAYLWDFGDGTSTSTSVAMAEHIYTNPGTYNASLTVTDDEGQSTSATILVTVQVHYNLMPVASFYYYPASPVVGQDVVFDGSMSYDPDGFVVNYSWYFGDMNWGGGLLVNHTYSSAGTYLVSLTVIDNEGGMSTLYRNVTVQPSQQGDLVLRETFDSWSSLQPGWTFWNSSSPIYNYIDVRDGSMYLSDYADQPVDDSLNAKAEWTSLVRYPESLTLSYRLYLPLASDEKYGYWGQYVVFDLFAPTDDPNVTTWASLTTRFLMDTWSGAVNGWSYVGSDVIAHKICDFQAGWHNVSVILTYGMPTWTAEFDGVRYPGLTFSKPGQTGFNVSKVAFVNSLREEVVVSRVDDLVIQRTNATPASPPTASFTHIVDGSTVHVDASGSTSEAGIATYAWEWGDGASEVNTVPTSSHTYSVGLSSSTSNSAQSSMRGLDAKEVGVDVPIPPYVVFGYVTDDNGDPVLDCQVMITNMNTGVDDNTTTDTVYGFYQYDLNVMSGGWQTGDVIRIFASTGDKMGYSEGIADSSVAYLWVDVVIYPVGDVRYYTVSLTVTDVLGQSAVSTATVSIPISTVADDAYEPDDEYWNATVLDYGTSQVHSINDGGADVDWFIFTVPTGTDVVLETLGTSGDTVLYLYDQFGVPTSPIAMDDNSGVGDFSRIVLNSSWAGTYYAKVIENGMDANIPSYTIRLGANLPTNQWTFMVYMDGDNDLEDVAITDFLEMSSVGSTDSVNIVLQMDRTPRYLSDYGNWSGTKRFYVTQGMTPDPSNAISDIGEQNMGSSSTLENFLTWATTNYPAENYMLVLWDHGSGWDGGVCYDETSDDSLELDEIESALVGSMNVTGQWIDSVAFDACLMGMVEVSYEIKEWTDVVVASEETVPWDGWPYDTIMTDLTTNPYMTASELGSVVVQRYMEFYGYGGMETMSALDISSASTLFSAIDAFAYQLIDYLSTNGTAVLSAWASTDYFSYYDYLDLYDFASTLAGLLPSGALNEAATNVTYAIDQAMIAEAHGAAHADAGGVSIYLPAYGYISRYDGLDFAMDTAWDDFVRLFSSGTGTEDSYEPDDTYQEASPIAIGETQQHSIDGGGSDVDWVTFYVNYSTTLTISTSGPMGDTVLFLYDSYGVPDTWIAYNDDYNGLWSSITYSFSPGAYYVKIVEYAMNQDISVYYLTLELGSGYNQPPYLSLFVAPDPPVAGIETLFDASGSYDVDGYIAMWNWYLDGYYLGSSSRMYYTFPYPGMHTMTLEVYDDDGASSSFSWTFEVVEATSPDSYEPDNFYLQATPIQSGETQTHTISDGGFDVDWLTFTLSETMDARVEALVLSGYYAVNVSLYNFMLVPDGPIALSDWWNGSGVVAVECVLSPGTYYVNISSSWGYHQVPAYTVSLTLSPVGPGDAYEPDDFYIDAQEIGMMTAQEHSILKGGWDVDWVTFNLTATTDVGLRTYGPADQYTDTVMWLYDSIGVPSNPITANDDVSGTLWSMIKITLPPGTYYVMIQAYDFWDEIPVYWLELNYSYNMNMPPVASAYIYPYNPAVGVPITFDGMWSYDEDGYIVSYEWDFGDGSTSNEAVVNHTYYAEGNYNVTLSVTDDDGAIGWIEIFLWVHDNDPPVVNFSYSPQFPSLYQYVYFYGVGCYDPDGWITHYTWTVDNSTWWTSYPDMYYYFSTPGDHPVTLTAYDNSGASSSITLIVHINEPPVAVISVTPEVGVVGGICTFDGSGSYDPEGGPLTYGWGFDDGGNHTGPVVDYVFYSTGIHTIMLYVVDEAGSYSYAYLDYVVVNPLPPVALISYSPPRPAVGQEVSFDASPSFDPDGSLVQYIWRFGDGTLGYGMQVTHVYQYPGTYTVTLTVLDWTNLADDDWTTITVVSTPVAAFQQMPLSPAVGEVANFFAYGSSDPSGLVSYIWSFGDGYYASGWQVAHAYSAVGTYTVTLTVMNTYGVTASVSKSVAVVAPGPLTVGMPGVTDGGDASSADISSAPAGYASASELVDGGVLLALGLALLVCVLSSPRTKK